MTGGVRVPDPWCPIINVWSQITLHGRISPVGGVKERVLGVRHACANQVIVPWAHRKDVGHDVPVQFGFARTLIALLIVCVTVGSRARSFCLDYNVPFSSLSNRSNFPTMTPSWEKNAISHYACSRVILYHL